MSLGDVFEEHLSLLSALQENYASSEDKDAILELIATQNNTIASLKQDEELAGKRVRELSAHVKEAAERAVYPKPEGAHAAARQDLLQETAAAKENVDSLNARLKTLEEQRAELQARLADMKSQAREIESSVQQTEPQLRYHLSLYSHVSHIAWDFRAPPTRAAGSVSDPVSHDIRPFDLSAQSECTVETADALWELMESKSSITV